MPGTVRAGRLYLGRPEPKESSVLDGCLTLCAMHRAVAAYWRQNVGAGKFIRPDGSTSQFVRFGFPGLADICGYFWGGRMFQIETKRPSGDARDAQDRFLSHASDANVLAMLVHDVDELVQAFDAVLADLEARHVRIGAKFVPPTPKRKPGSKRAGVALPSMPGLDLGPPF